MVVMSAANSHACVMKVRQRTVKGQKDALENKRDRDRKDWREKLKLSELQIHQ